MYSKFYLIVAAIITVLLLPNSSLAKGPVPYAKMDKALRECKSSVQDMKDTYVQFLINDITQVEIALSQNHHKNKKLKKQGIVPKKAHKELVTYFKKGNLNFNKRIKQYQNKCKLAEKLLRSNVMLGEE